MTSQPLQALRSLGPSIGMLAARRHGQYPHAATNRHCKNPATTMFDDAAMTRAGRPCSLAGF